jgi:hypothetical protein
MAENEAPQTPGAAASTSGPVPPAPLTPPAERPRPADVTRTSATKGGGLGRFVFFLRMLWYFVWNLPGFLNIVSALKLKTTRSCIIRGYTKSIYLYPLIPSAAIMSLLYKLNPEMFAFPLGVAFTVMLFFVFVMVTEDVKGRNAFAAVAVLFGLAALYIALRIAGVAINEWFVNTFGFFAPSFNPGAAMLLAALCGVQVIWSFIRSRFSSSIQVQANQFVTIEMHQKTPYPVEEWRLRARISDWLERMWMGADDLFILSNWGTGRDSDRDHADAWDNRIQFTLHNVPGARIVEDLVFAAIAVHDVAPTPNMNGKA